MIPYVLVAYGAISLVALILYGADKRKAKRKRFRTPESVLLCIGFFGGAVGALIGMNLFHHKTRHWYFWAVNLSGLAWQAAVVWLLL
ncbi:MAG: DUF1294 domain-containing protein [Clostridia bacterium]|nr:DUF1294 domain-containing protein [Clostridia bacterium]